MRTEQRNGPAAGIARHEPGSVTKLVGSILEDIQELFKQQLELFHAEIKDDMKRTKEASVLLAGGMFVLLVCVMLACTMLAYLLNWIFPELPLWGAYGILVVATGIAGAILFFMGRNQFSAFNPLPDKSVEALKENLQWTNPTTNSK